MNDFSVKISLYFSSFKNYIKLELSKQHRLISGKLEMNLNNYYSIGFPANMVVSKGFRVPLFPLRQGQAAAKLYQTHIVPEKFLLYRLILDKMELNLNNFSIQISLYFSFLQNNVKLELFIQHRIKSSKLEMNCNNFYSIGLYQANWKYI